MSVSSSTTVRSLLLNCSYCGQLADVMDHVVSLSEIASWNDSDWKNSLIRDLNDPMNLTPACVACNQAKGSKPLDYWITQMVIGQIDPTGVVMAGDATVQAGKAIRSGVCADWVREAYVSVLHVLFSNLSASMVDA